MENVMGETFDYPVEETDYFMDDSWASFMEKCDDPAARPVKRDRYVLELLRDLGYTAKWRAQVAASILVHHVNKKNSKLARYLQRDPFYKSTVYLIWQLFHNLGLKSTENMFLAETGILGFEHKLPLALKKAFPHFRVASSVDQGPPLLLQVLVCVLMKNLEQNKATFVKSGPMNVQGGVLENVNPSFLGAHQEGLVNQMHPLSIGYNSDDFDEDENNEFWANARNIHDPELYGREVRFGPNSSGC